MNHRIACYCAFCKSPRKVYSRKHMGWMHLLGAAALTFTFIYLFTDDPFDLLIPVLFGFFCLIAEVGVQLRWRMSIICQFCGFDPALYLRNSALAVAQVKEKLAQREKDPRTLLSRRPALNLHQRKAAPQRPGEKMRHERRAQLVRQAESVAAIESARATSKVPFSIPDKRANRDLRLE